MRRVVMGYWLWAMGYEPLGPRAVTMYMFGSILDSLATGASLAHSP